MGVYEPNLLEQDAIGLVQREKGEWEDAICFVTDRIAFKMREIIRVLRKNYWGIFDQPIDPVSGRPKTWVPLTESTVDSVLKNIDLDAKDINFRAKKPGSVGLTAIVRSFVRDYLDSIYFGEILDELERTMVIDGTAVWKTYEETDENGKKILRTVPVDLLNFYIDPTAHSIAETNAVIERALMLPDQVKTMTGWINTQDVQGFFGLSQNEPGLNGLESSGRTKMVEIFERWGQMPKNLLTGNPKDEDDYVEGHIVVSNLTRCPVVHLIEENKKGLKPYEEAWYTRIPGRWYGRGIAEKLLMLQLWVNTIVNIRIARSYVSQLGIFKIRKGSGITPQMLGRLAVNGALVVNNPDDITQMAVQEASQASYNDEQTVSDWAAKVTSSFESVTGEPLPSSMPATNAVIQNRSASSQFVFVKKGLGIFLQRWVKRHVLPFIQKQMKVGTVVRVMGDVDEIRALDENIANELVVAELQKKTDAGEFVDTNSVWQERQNIIERLQKGGADRFIKLGTTADLADYDVQVYVTNEEVDKAVLVQNLVSVLQTAPNIPGSDIDPVAVAQQIFDLMGLDASQLRKKNPQPGVATPQMAPQGNQAIPVPQVSGQQITTRANTLSVMAAPSV